MTEMDELLITIAVQRLVVKYWSDVDTNWGAEAHLMFTPNGVFSGEGTPLEGREQIKGFYDWRKRRGERTARHIVNNFWVDIQGPQRVIAHYVMSIHAADGAPVLRSAPPILISDVTETCVRQADGSWLIERKQFRALFKSDVPATTMPAGELAAIKVRQASAGKDRANA
jgi:SnoaL-like domain